MLSCCSIHLHSIYEEFIYSRITPQALLDYISSAVVRNGEQIKMSWERVGKSIFFLFFFSSFVSAD